MPSEVPTLAAVLAMAGAKGIYWEPMGDSVNPPPIQHQIKMLNIVKWLAERGVAVYLVPSDGWASRCTWNDLVTYTHRIATTFEQAVLLAAQRELESNP